MNAAPRRDPAGGSPQKTDDWERHWSAYATSAEENPAQAFRRRLILAILDTDHPPERMLDIGSGTGDLLAALRTAYPTAELRGLDVSRTGLEFSRRKVPGASFVQRDLTRDERPAPEDVHWATHAVCSEVLEHVDEPQHVLENALPYLAKGCQLVVTVPGGPMTAYDRHIGHRRHYRPSELAGLLRRAGLGGVDAWSAGFPFFNLYRLTVHALGNRVIEVAGEEQPSRSASAAMHFFAALLGRNPGLRRWGWQIVATGRVHRIV